MLATIIGNIVAALIVAVPITFLIIFSIKDLQDRDIPIVKPIFALLFLAVIIFPIKAAIEAGINGPKAYQNQEYTVSSIVPNSENFVLIQTSEYRKNSGTVYYYCIHKEDSKEITYLGKRNVTLRFSDEVEPSVWTYKESWEFSYTVLIVPTNTYIDIR